jgi:hypothetical protein
MAKKSSRSEAQDGFYNKTGPGSNECRKTKPEMRKLIMARAHRRSANTYVPSAAKDTKIHGGGGAFGIERQRFGPRKTAKCNVQRTAAIHKTSKAWLVFIYSEAPGLDDTSLMRARHKRQLLCAQVFGALEGQLCCLGFRDRSSRTRLSCFPPWFHLDHSHPSKQGQPRAWKHGRSDSLGPQNEPRRRVRPGKATTLDLGRAR